ncbi:MAG: ABC transporter permease [Bacteriovoracaceae bacterium]|jgi:ABC-2 type transport system permease protein|nr:ABC transporter permease [Bacteriovoracaceae bacterium]
MKFWLQGCYELYTKEIKDSFLSPFVYILSASFILLIGWIFFSLLVASKDITQGSLTTSIIAPTFSMMRFVFMFVCPLLTMRLLSEEKKNHTIELLYLSNLSDWQIIISKFFSSLTIILFMLALTLLFPVILSLSGYSDWGVVSSSYLGTVLLSMAYISLGLFTSSLTSNYVISLIISIFMMLGLWFLVLSAATTSNYIVGQILKYFSDVYHYEHFVTGALRSYSFIYFFSFMFFFLFGTHQSLGRRNW